jgi:hypothetical protein
VALKFEVQRDHLRRPVGRWTHVPDSALVLDYGSSESVVAVALPGCTKAGGVLLCTAAV